MEKIKVACGNDRDLYYEIEALLIENNCLLCNAIDIYDEDLEGIENGEGLKRSVYEYYEEDYSLMGRMCKDLEGARELLDQIKIDNKILTNLAYQIIF